MAKWILTKEEANIKLMSETLKISETMAQVMVNRQVRTKNTAIKFLNPSLTYLNSTSSMKDLTIAMGIIVQSAARQEKIAIYGDYDVDGVTSTVILYKMLMNYGADVLYYIPHREEEGYGLNKTAVKNLREMEVDLLITCDNGITSLEEVLLAKELGMKVIILDHHEPGYVEDENGGKIDVIPQADAVIDLKRQKCEYPFKMLCAAGLSYKFAKAFFQYVEMPFDDEEESLVFAMIATFCDIVDLKDENRIIAKNGLDILNKNSKINLGLCALMKEKSLEDKKIGSFHVGFIIGPCINATGRLDRATLAVELFLAENEDRAKQLAKRLSELNEERKEMTSAAVEYAIENFSNAPFRDDRVIVLYEKEIHESIAGIVAGRIKDRFYRPAIVLTQGETSAKGSARSIEGYNIFDELYQCRDLFQRFGGHAMAAGLSIEEEKIPILRKRLNDACKLTDDDFIENIKIDLELPLERVTYELAEELFRLEPFGKENKEPLFVTKQVTPSELRMIEDKNTMIFQFPIQGRNRQIKALSFGMVDVFKERLRIVYDEYDYNKILRGMLRNINFRMDMVY